MRRHSAPGLRQPSSAVSPGKNTLCANPMPRAPSLPPRSAQAVLRRDLTPGRRGMRAYVPARMCGARPEAYPRTRTRPSPSLIAPRRPCLTPMPSLLLHQAGPPCRRARSGVQRAPPPRGVFPRANTPPPAVAARWRLRDASASGSVIDAMVRVADAAAVMAIAVVMRAQRPEPSRRGSWAPRSHIG